MPSRRADGTLVFKILIYGPPESGVKTVFDNLYSDTGRFTRKYEFHVPSGIKIFFDWNSKRTSNCVFQVNAIIPKKYNKVRYPTDLRGSDAIIFIWDSLIDKWSQNIWHLKDLLNTYVDLIVQTNNTLYYPEVPLVVLANKRDLEEIVDISKISQVLNTARLGYALIYETIASTGINLKRAFVYIIRQAILNHYKRLGQKPPEPKDPILFLKFIKNFSNCPVCGNRNHENYLKEFFYTNDRSKSKLRKSLLKLMEKSNQFEEIYYNKIILGIPCCSCFKKFFYENVSLT